MRLYHDEDRAAALAALKANGGNINRTAADLGIARTTLQEWAKRPDRAAPEAMREGAEAELAAKLMRVANQLVDAIPKKIGTASLRDVAVSAAVAIDKARLLRGEPTERTAHEFPDLERLRAMPYDELLRLHRETLALPAADCG